MRALWISLLLLVAGVSLAPPAAADTCAASDPTVEAVTCWPVGYVYCAIYAIVHKNLVGCVLANEPPTIVLP